MDYCGLRSGVCGGAVVLHAAGSFTGWFLQSSLGRDWRSDQPLWPRESSCSMNLPFKTVCFKTLLPLPWKERDCMSKIDLRVQVEKGSCVYFRQLLPSCSCWPYWESVPFARLLSLLLCCWTWTPVIWRYFQGCSKVKHPGLPSNSRWCYLQVFFYPPLFWSSTVLPFASSSVSGAALLFLSCWSQANDSSFYPKQKEPLVLRKLRMGIKNLFLGPDSVWSVAVCVPGVIAEFATKGEEAGRNSHVGHS